jgi:hypothetical protein
MRGKNEKKKIKVGDVGRLNTQNSTVYSRRDFSFPPKPTALLVNNNNLYQYIIIDVSVYYKVSGYPRLKAYIRGASGKRKKKKHKLRCRPNRVILLVVKCLITYSSFTAKMSFLLFIYVFFQTSKRRKKPKLK